jgi:hypothetical protein
MKSTRFAKQEDITSSSLTKERRLSLIFDRRFAFLPGSENAKTTRKNNGVHHRSPTIWQFQG